MHHLTTDRFDAVMAGSELTKAEQLAGWHFCPDADGRLVGPSDGSPGDWRRECQRGWDGCRCGVRKETK